MKEEMGNKQNEGADRKNTWPLFTIWCTHAATAAGIKTWIFLGFNLTLSFVSVHIECK